MGKRVRRENVLEERTRKRARRSSFQNAVIGALAVGSMLTVAAIAPKVLSLLKQKHLDHVLPQDPKQRVRETLSRLKKKGWITYEEIRSKHYPRLTALGKKQVGRAALGAMTIRKPRRWDERWRMVIFDIKESRRGDRIQIRRMLQRLGLLRIQDSVWIYPYDCEEIIALIKTDMKIGRDVLYVIADAIEFDRPYREHFDLPLE